MQLVSSKGVKYEVVRQLGMGGEGAAYLLGGESGLVAKIYHKPLLHAQVEKLKIMAAMCDPDLLSCAAWPTDLVTRAGEHRPCGFIMPLAAGSELHEIYGPASRRQKMPLATWEHLIIVARNAASVFDIFHQRGVVIGDVNEKNLIVRDNGHVVLVDCDSCQLSRNGRVYPCRVGVPLYTPPELQGGHLASIQRLPTHDAFGLAVLIFQLLFMGRHPYAGVMRKAQWMPLENGDAIRRGLYAYGRNARGSGIQPPPNSLPTTAVSAEMQELFERSFSTGPASTAVRPSAAQWMRALDELRRTLVTCRKESSHRHANHSALCPWCSLSTLSGVHFFVRVSFARFDFSTLDVPAFRKAIEELMETPVILRGLDTFAAGFIPVPVPVPDHVKGHGPGFYGGIALVLVCVSGFLNGFFSIVGILGGVALIWKGWRKPGYAKEAEQREARRDECRRQALDLHAEMKAVAETHHRNAAQGRKTLNELFLRYEDMPQAWGREMASLDSGRWKSQLDDFLKQFLLSRHKFPGIGQARQALLLSHGVETAADIHEKKLRRVPGFRRQLGNALIQWRRSCEKQFKFNPSLPVPAAEVQALHRRFRRLKTTLERQQREMCVRLPDESRQAANRLSDLSLRLETLCRAWKQAEADWRAVQSWSPFQRKT